jgi:hypothetical protein
MSNDEQDPPIEVVRPVDNKRKPWFGPNRSGVGFHPYRWQGWLIIVIVVAAIVTVIVLLRTGVL